MRAAGHAAPGALCYKIAARYGRKDISIIVQETGFTGYLLRVLRDGEVGAGDVMRLVDRDDSHAWTVAEAGRVVNVDRNDDEAARRLLEVAALGAGVRRTLVARLARSKTLGLDLDRLYLSGRVET